jgi:hypothetical protein
VARVEGHFGENRGRREDAPWPDREIRLLWSHRGALQRAWSEPFRERGGSGTWRLHLRTLALEGFTGAAEQLEALSTEPGLSTVASLVRDPGCLTRLELGSCFDLRERGLGLVLDLLSCASRIQAAEARRLSGSSALATTGLLPGVDRTAGGEGSVPLPPLLASGPPRLDREARAKLLSECLETLRSRTPARAVATPWGISASFALGGAANGRFLLEIRADARHPGLGRGLSVVLRTPLAAGLMVAIAQNERELGPHGHAEALGGWRVDDGRLVHASFHPEAFRAAGLGVEVALASFERARDAASAGLDPVQGGGFFLLP